MKYTYLSVLLAKMPFSTFRQISLAFAVKQIRVFIVSETQNKKEKLRLGILVM